ncbi:MAG: DeoR/GlpR transcriptional regulator [Ktedonobacteraceae bacterium]|nr:DeoR/GlpR transcriptional regulator [Ktedonobacteraceae bacterium]MBO0794489.1 DeoR/GlpR transcriptional regulator [Ktedonobacteraceae bacterium]
MYRESSRLPAPEGPGGPALFTYERRQRIFHLLEEQQRVTVPALSQLFLVSEVTIRKDLAWLESQKMAVRTHGGAILAAQVPTLPEMEFDVRESLHHSEKERIGAAAAALVQDGETIYLDASTTALAMAPFLQTRRELTIVTNGLRIGMELIGVPGVSVLMPGGMLRPESFSLVGNWGTAVMQQIHISKAFMGARGFTLQEGLTDVNNEEVELKRTVVQIAREVIALIDYSKWGQVALATFCQSERIKTIITDKETPEEQIQQARSRGIEIVQV